MRILVTGGAGFIGSALIRFLIREVGADVLNIDKLTYAANLQSLSSIQNDGRYRFVQADSGDAVAMSRAFEEFEPDRVMHLAAESHVDRSISGAEPFILTNIVGTYTLLNAALAHWRSLTPQKQSDFRFLQVSTDEVYGSLPQAGLFSEDTPYDPRSPYSATKAASDHLVSAWGHTYGLPILISNCSNNYGPYQFPEKLIPLIILNALDGRPLPVYGDGQQIRDWLHVDDHVRALHLICERGRIGETYNVGGRNERTNLSVVESACDCLDEVTGLLAGGERRRLIEFVADRPGHDRRYAIDASKLEAELGWRATYDFDQGLAATIDWYLGRRDWWAPLRKQYAGARLGLLESVKSDGE